MLSRATYVVAYIFLEELFTLNVYISFQPPLYKYIIQVKGYIMRWHNDWHCL